MIKETKSNSKPFYYLLITLIWSWVFWFGAVITSQGWLQFPNVILTLLGFLGPFIVSTTMVKLGYWNQNLKEFLLNNFDLRNLSISWCFYLIGFILILTGLPLLIGSLVFNQSLSQLANFNPPTIFILVGIIAGAVEEPGWRGYAQKGLQKYMSPLNSGLVIGIFWALWHLPLFLLEGTYQYSVGFATSGFWFFNISVLVASVFYAWLYNAAGQIGIIAVLYHGLGNAMSEILSFANTSFEIELIEFCVEAGISLVIVVIAWELMTEKINKT